MKISAANELRSGGVGRRRYYFGLLLAVSLPLFVTIIRGEPDSAGTKILSRQRRYLVFPEGSSLQLVYDETIPILDYTLLMTTGETLALAYELPHRPISEDDFLRHAILNEPADSVKRKEDVGPQVAPLFGADSNGNRVRDSFYVGNSSEAWQKYWRESSAGGGNNNLDSYYSSSGGVVGSDWDRSGWNDIGEPASMTKPVDPTKPKDIVISPNFPFNRKRPVVFLPMGKRSIQNSNGIPEESATRKNATREFFLQHHRNSRYHLYQLIDKFLISRGHNGMDCILKTLCEVGQRPKDAPKGSFVAEIVRAIFRLPDTEDTNGPFQHFHQASRATRCSDLFTGCSQSIWTARFLLGL